MVEPKIDKMVPTVDLIPTIDNAKSPVDAVIALLVEKIDSVETYLINDCTSRPRDCDLWLVSKSIFPSVDIPGPDGTNNPEATVNDIVVCQTSGKASNPKWLIDYPGITILVRAAGSRYPQAYDICRYINDALLGCPSCYYGPGYPAKDGFVPINVIGNESNKDLLVSITQQGQIIDLGRESRDTVKRCNFSLNYNLIVQPAQTPLSCREPLL